MKHTSANVVHSAARQRSTLCRSTTYRAHQARITRQRIINLRIWVGGLENGGGGGWVGSGVPGPDPADVPGKGEGVLPMRVWVPIEEQGLQEMAKDAEMTLRQRGWTTAKCGRHEMCAKAA